MKSGKIQSDKITIGSLFENFWFEIPNYQRHYVWDNDDVLKLLEDVNTHHNLNKNKDKNSQEEYFLGSLVLQKKKEGMDYDVIDGQQMFLHMIKILM